MEEKAMVLKEDPFGLRPVWTALLSIYDAVSTLCKEHGLVYYVACGTLLGAVRHKGFIPWDDDFDIMMPRSDYMKFREIALKELPPHLKYIFYGNTPEFLPYSFCKIQETRRLVVEKIENEVGHFLPHGLYIDIFPLDGAPNTLVEKIQFYYNSFALFSARSSFYGVMKAPNLVKFLWRGIGRIFATLKYKVSNVSDLYCRYEMLSMSFPFCEGRLCGCVQLPRSSGIGILYGLCNYSDYGDCVKLSFCGREVPAPSNYDRYLRCLYGDYMQLPPKNMRIPIHSVLESAPWKYGPTIL